MSNNRNGDEKKTSREAAAEEQDQKDRQGEARTERRQKMIALAISFVIGFGLWLYVMEVVNPVIQRTFSGIDVRVTNETALDAAQLTVTSMEDPYVRVRVSGKRRTLMNLDAEDFIATVDASECTQGENYVKVEVRTQAPVAIEKVASPQIRLNVEPIVTESKAVKVTFNGEVKDGYQPVTVEQAFAEVDVTGAESAVAKVKEIQTELSTEKLSEEPADFQQKLTAVDRKGREVGDVQLGQKRLSFLAQLYVQKEVELGTSYTGQVKSGCKLVAFSAPEQIRIAVPETEADRVFSVTTDTVDLTDIEKNTKVDLTLHLPDGAVLADDQEKPQAVVKVAKITQQMIRMNTDEIHVENLPEGRTLTFDAANVSITLKGTASELSAIEKKNLRLSVDASQAGVGTAELPLTVDIETNDGTPDVEVQTSSVAVTVR